mmetsp:Transcript_43627/g.124424  ORF Transcript_43627/g.124424 Transcript_43627/m.124424 type:complete len:253 (-) Transcript_43627:34-792(-)
MFTPRPYATGGTLGGARLAGGAVTGGRMVYAGGRAMGSGASMGGGASAGDCAGTCCGMETACCEAEGAMTNSNWVYVGEGRGAYATVQQYNFVGQGAGSFDQEVVTTFYGWKLKRCCIAVLALLLLPALVYLLMMLVPGGGGTSGLEGQVVISTPAPPVMPPVVATTREPFNCYVGGLWSLARKAYCCRTHRRGCTTPPPPPPPRPPSIAVRSAPRAAARALLSSWNPSAFSSTDVAAPSCFDEGRRAMIFL